METTFGATNRWTLTAFTKRQDGEFLRIGTELLGSEELSDLVYRTYLDLISEGWAASKEAAIDDIGEANLNGFYVPCCERFVLAGQVDLVNDELPDHAGIV